MLRAWGVRAGFLLLPLLLCVASAGCSTRGHLPCNPFLGCPARTVRATAPSSPGTASASQSPTLPSMDRPDIALTGRLVTDTGLAAAVQTQFRFGDGRYAQHSGRLRVEVPVTGSVTVVNTSDQFNPAAVSVQFEILAAYARGSEVCRLMGSGSDKGVAGGYCWQRIAGTVVSNRPPAPLSVAEVRSAPISPGSVIHVDGAGRASGVLRALRHPSLVVASTNPVDDHGPFRFKHACKSNIAIPSAPNAPAETGTVDHVIVGMTDPVTCGQVAGL